MRFVLRELQYIIIPTVIMAGMVSSIMNPTKLDLQAHMSCVIIINTVNRLNREFDLYKRENINP